ncbi:hypothetical protein PV328_011371 [Microctonus aethiopoides]|uniref:BTB domain-containing protein n=1 Tax=Microctonus aethiopoides TaxID=144406 RepID=A0AA39C4A3_9HYME|nr:hypothetical protein PV328_011371 [Microctonus aethiopoides]
MIICICELYIWQPFLFDIISSNFILSFFRLSNLYKCVEYLTMMKPANESSWNNHFEYERNFVKCAEDENDKIIFKSSTFTVNNNTKWHLKLYIHGYENDAKDFIGIFTYFDNINEEPVEIFASQIYFLVNSDGRKIKLGRVRMHKFIAITLNNWGCEKLYNFTKFYMNKKFSDVTLILYDERIPAHKAILSAKSPIFASMFDDNNINEERNNLNKEIIIDDFNPETFKAMLHYIYTNEIKDVDRLALNLLWTANKYEVKELKEICEKTLCQKIIIDNATDYLVYSNLFHAETLMKYCQEFIHAHIEEIMKTPKYEAMEKRYPELIADLYRSSVMGNQHLIIKLIISSLPHL